MGSFEMPASYDAWVTAGPPEYKLVCPNCGADSEEIEEFEVKGLEGRGLMSYPIRVGTELRRVSSSKEMRELAIPETIFKCECGLIHTSSAWITYEEWHGDQEPDEIG